MFQRIRRLLQPRAPLLPAYRWGLAAGGLLTEINQGGYESLWFAYGRARSKECLREGWEVVDRPSLNRIHEWLCRAGHRLPCARDCRLVHDMQMGIAPYNENDPRIELYRWVADNMEGLANSRLVAWDFTRLINVARWGYTAGFLEEDTAWKWILDAARILQTSYTSWREIGSDFLLGYSYWSGGKPPHDHWVAAYKTLTETSNSPWQSISWRTPLSTGQ